MCDTFVVTNSGSGPVLFAKNSDREYTEAQHLEHHPRRAHPIGARVRLTHIDIAQTRRTHAVLLSKPYWLWGGEIGSNEHGLTIGNEAIYAEHLPASSAPGIIGMDFIRLALERARDADEAVSVITALLYEHGQSGLCSASREMTYHNSYILADRNGAKVLETIGRDWVVRTVGASHAISNAPTIDRDYDAASATLGMSAAGIPTGGPEPDLAFKTTFESLQRKPSGDYRRGRMLELLAEHQGSMTADGAFNILRDHQEGPPETGGARLCAHRKVNPLGQTTASWVAVLGDGEPDLHWLTATAAPCSSVFKPLLFGCAIPDHGPRPGAKKNEAALWWRHERLRQAVDEAGRSLQDTFFHQRDKLEQSFLERAAGLRRRAYDQEEGQTFVDACWREALAFEDHWLLHLSNADPADSVSGDTSKPA